MPPQPFDPCADLSGAALTHCRLSSQASAAAAQFGEAIDRLTTEAGRDPAVAGALRNMLASLSQLYRTALGEPSGA